MVKCFTETCKSDLEIRKSAEFVCSPPPHTKSLILKLIKKKNIAKMDGFDLQKMKFMLVVLALLYHFRPIVWAAKGEFVSKQAHRIFKSGQKSLTAEYETQ